MVNNQLMATHASREYSMRKKQQDFTVDECIAKTYLRTNENKYLLRNIQTFKESTTLIFI